MYTSMENTITMTMKTHVATDHDHEDARTSPSTTTMTNVAADTITIMKNMSIITATIMTNVAVDTIMTMNIITIMNAAVDMITMIITIIMQMRYSQAGAVETIKKYTREDLEKKLEALSASEDYGIILRAKGMLPAEDGTWIYFDMVPEETEIREGAPEYTGRLCVIGSKLKEDKLAELFGLA